MAEISLEGFLSQDAELRYTQSGHPVLNFTIPDNHRRKNGDQWEDDGTTWYRVTYWATGQNREAELQELAQRLTKGSRVMIRGDLRLSETEKDGKVYTNLDVTARRVGILVQPPRNQGGYQQGGSKQGWGGQQSNPWATDNGAPF